MFDEYHVAVKYLNLLHEIGVMQWEDIPRVETFAKHKKLLCMHSAYV